MASIDTPTLINWLVSGFIGIAFGVVSAWVTHRFERQRDDTQWRREKELLTQQFAHDRELLEVQFQQKLQELKTQLSDQQSREVRTKLSEGLDNSERTIRNLERARTQMGRTLLKIDYGFIQNMSVQFKSAAGESQGILARLQKSVDDVKDAWPDEQQQHFYDEWQGYRQAISGSIEILWSIAQEMDALAKSLDELDNGP